VTTTLQIALLDAAAARAGDQAAVAAGDTWPALMERAAGHLARGVVAAGGRGYGLRVALLVGKGNNGGDGWAAARRLEREYGAQAWVVAPDGVDVEVSDETAANRAAWLGGGRREDRDGSGAGRDGSRGGRRGGRTSAGTDDLDAALAWCDVAVDCLLGTGVSGAPRGPAGVAADALLRAHGRGTTVVACDVPSGVDGDDGRAPDGAVRADVTVTFGGVKRGLLLHPGAAHAGRVLLGELGERYDPGEALPDPASPAWAALTPAGAAPERLGTSAEKRARGVVLAVAGAVGTGGAAALTASGALHAGAGLVTVATPEPVRVEVASRTDAGVMVHGVPADEHGALSPDAVHGLPELSGFDVVTAGPGLGHGDGTAAVVAHLRAHARKLVLDADAINVHRDAPDALADHAGELVLTPHERELARMGGGEDGPDAWAHRVERVPRLARELRATIVAKGPGTIVAAPDGRVWVTPVGSAALGSGGTGDVLSGIIAAAIAAAEDVPLAVARAVWWHAAAGELAGRDRADRATATDLLRTLPATLADLAAVVTDRGRRAATYPDSSAAPGSSASPGLATSRRAGDASGRGTSARGGQREWPRAGILPWDEWRQGRG
jgi:ADP-dependent NAD(P)H-hydrate dehydratase / NAD(P)H-hydrate epimerase